MIHMTMHELDCIMTQRMEDKQKSPRLNSFESVMPQVDELTDDCFFGIQDGSSAIGDNRPVNPTPWLTSTSSQQPCTPAPTTALELSTLDLMQGGLLQSQQTYRFPN